jgi:hypothetical protein
MIQFHSVMSACFCKLRKATLSHCSTTSHCRVEIQGGNESFYHLEILSENFSSNFEFDFDFVFLQSTRRIGSVHNCQEQTTERLYRLYNHKLSEIIIHFQKKISLNCIGGNF